MKHHEKIAMAFEVIGTCMGNIELEKLGKHYGLKYNRNGDDIDLQVSMIVEELGVWRCNTCDWWVDEAELHNDICSGCYALDDDE